MSDEMHPSRRSTELSVLGQLRRYEDPAVLDRAWSRLENRRRRPAGPSKVVRVLSAAALVAGGIFVGVMVERYGGTPERQMASPVFATAEAPAGPVNELSVPHRSPDRDRLDQPKEEARKSVPVRRRVSNLSADIEKMMDEEFSDNTSLESLQVEESPAPPAKPAWLALAERGDFAAAFQQLDESGGFDGVLQSGSPEELMTLVDVARYVGNQGRATQALRVVTERHQGDANAPLAAMMLGNLLSRAGDQAGASEAYALNRRLSPGGDFAEDALVREFDMALTAQDLAAVQRLIAQYEEEFPQGRHLQDLKSEAARLAETVEQSPEAQRVEAESPAEPAADPGELEQEPSDEALPAPPAAGDEVSDQEIVEEPAQH